MSDNSAKVTDFVRLAARGMVTIICDSTIYGVEVPAEHLHNPQLVLNFAIPRGARDWSATEEGLSETLSFRGRRVVVKVPWEAVLAMRGEEPLPASKPALRLVKGGA